jgi:nucleoside-diphosphate-sugar epimerase
LDSGYVVRACVRNADDNRKTAFLKAMPEFKTGQLALYSADMTKPGVYDDIFRGCHTVFHTAEVMMSFAPGRDLQQAVQEFGQPFRQGVLAERAFESSQLVVDSINKSGTVATLIYTSSIMAMMDADVRFYEVNPVIDETRHATDSSVNGGYSVLKDSTEKFFFDAAASSQGRWIAISANPGDILGPILSAHHATETWQGKVGKIAEGESPQQETSTLSIPRPWMTVDVRDVAKAHVLLADSSTVQSGSRFLLVNATKVWPEKIGKHINGLYPAFAAATGVQACDDENTLQPISPVWDRVQVRSDRVHEEVGISFHSWEDTLKDTIDSLVALGGLQPRLGQELAMPSAL